MRRKRFIILLFTCCFYSLLISAQQIQLKGQIFDVDDERIPVPACIVVNMRTQQGMLADESGMFTINVYKSDTLAFRNIGYQLKFVHLKDSIIVPGFKLNVKLKKQAYMVQEVMIMSQRGLNSIENDVQKLGYDESKYKLQGIDAIQSPITALYQAFSRKERSRREVAFMLNEDERRTLLRELLHYYISAGYIYLPADEYDHFINYCGINEAQLKTLTQYEMAVYVKRKLELYNQRRN